MTSKLTITDERVISVIERLEHYACNLKWTNVRGAQDLLTAADGLRELQQRRKAAMDSEPAPDGEQLAIENFRSAIEGIGHIRRTLEETFGGLHGTHVEPDVLMDCKTICDAIYAAYGHAQPAPVVPDAYVRDEHGRMMLNGVCEPKIGFGTGWNACRAAMLASAPQSPGSEPSTVPGKWIPVSERMPEVGDIVLTAMGGVVNVGETECSAANCRFFTSVISGRELPATHWMQLPAAPQEVGDA